MQDLGEPLRLALHSLVERGEVSDEPDVLHRLLAGVGNREVESPGPASASSRGLAVGVPLHGEVLERPLQRRIHVAPLDERATHVDDRPHRLDPRGAAVDARHARRALPDAFRTVDPREDILALARARLLERARSRDQRGRTDEAGLGSGHRAGRHAERAFDAVLQADERIGRHRRRAGGRHLAHAYERMLVGEAVIERAHVDDDIRERREVRHRLDADVIAVLGETADARKLLSPIHSHTTGAAGGMQA